MKELNGKVVNGAAIQLCLAKFPLHSERGKDKRQSRVTISQDWKPKKIEEGGRVPEVRVRTLEVARDRIRRTVIISLKEVYNPQDFRNFLVSNGGSSAKVITMGPKELALEFPSFEEMGVFLSQELLLN